MNVPATVALVISALVAVYIAWATGRDRTPVTWVNRMLREHGIEARRWRRELKKYGSEKEESS